MKFQNIIFLIVVGIALLITVLEFFTQQPATAPQYSGAEGIHKIRHLIIIMQENRAFDHYFGTFPGADGIPMKDGVPTVCVPDGATGECVKPYHDPNDQDEEGPHFAPDEIADVDGGKMDGFIDQQLLNRANTCAKVNSTYCSDPNWKPDVLGYHDER